LRLRVFFPGKLLTTDNPHEDIGPEVKSPVVKQYAENLNLK
jgi:hypothetical protein